MIKYTLSTQNKAQHFLDILCEIPVQNQSAIEIQLPAWRPGRYELGNFAKNIQSFEVYDEHNEPLQFYKITKDRWSIKPNNNSEKLFINYNYYAVDFNAGSTYVGEDVLYVNPVNCFLYVEELMNEPCSVEVPKEENQQIACGLKSENNVLKVSDFHQLVDSPFIISSQLQSKTYQSNGVEFYIWFYGECKPPWDKVVKDFKQFTDYQIQKFGDFPVLEYHFINIIHTYSSYHGVEHQNSTIITLGPTYDVFDKLYTELLGVSSHELYHTWNIKNIRPKEMMPYNYKAENYSRLGYVAEGVTTYMGDLVLFESGVFGKEQYAKEFTSYLTRHFNNDGRLNLSVADSSFDTWLDGYEMGIPDRKSSIYTEGALLAFLVDVEIRKATNEDRSLHDVMALLYEKFGKEEKGYTEQDYLDAVKEVSSSDFIDAFYENYITEANDLTQLLDEALTYKGFNLEIKESANYSNRLGLKGTNEKDGSFKVVHVKKDSLAYQAGLSRNDVIYSINGKIINSDINQWFTYYGLEEDVLLTVHRDNTSRETRIKYEENDNQFLDYQLS